MIKQLDETSCLDVIRSIYDDLGYDNMNALLTQIILKLCDNVTTTNLINIENTINRIMINLKTTDNNNEKIKEKNNINNNIEHSPLI